MRAYFAQFVYGRYPVEARWRVDLLFVIFAAGLVPMLVPTAPFKRENILYMAGVFPVAALLLLTGGNFDYGSLPRYRWIDIAGGRQDRILRSTM